MSEYVRLTPNDLAQLEKELHCVFTHLTKGIKRVLNGEAVCMVAFDRWMPNSVQANIWSKFPGAITRRFICEAFNYAFNTCGRSIVIITVMCNNAASLELNRRLGFRELYRLKDGYEIGTDMAIQVMRREECRWLNEVPSGERRLIHSTGS